MTAYARPHDLIESFLSEAWETTGELESAPFLLGHAEGMHRLVVASHRLKGSAGLYQYAEVSSLAGLLERVFESAHLFNAEERKLALDFSAQVTAVLSEALERIQTTGDEGQPGLSLAALGGGDLLQRLLVKNPSHFKRSPNGRKPWVHRRNSHTSPRTCACSHRPNRPGDCCASKLF
jgi:chemosensory pili system protein ChpA (sensor histidine kinase/response regulator)